MPDPKGERRACGRVEQVGFSEQKEGESKVVRESDQPVVLGDGRAVHMGKGLTEIRSLQRKHCPDMKGRNHNANLPEGNSNVRRRFFS